MRGTGAESCPGEDAVRAVKAHLGYDPFFAWARDTLFVEVSRVGGVYRLVVRFVGDDSNLRGAREMTLHDRDCAAVIDALGLTISLTIDPSVLLGGPVRAPETAPDAPAAGAFASPASTSVPTETVAAP